EVPAVPSQAAGDADRRPAGIRPTAGSAPGRTLAGGKPASANAWASEAIDLLRGLRSGPFTLAPARWAKRPSAEPSVHRERDPGLPMIHLAAQSPSNSRPNFSNRSRGMHRVTVFPQTPQWSCHLITVEVT